MHRRYDSYRPSAQRNDSHRRSYSRSRKRSRSQSSSRSRSRSEERDRGRGRSPRTREHWEQEASLDRIALEHRARSPRRTRLQSRSPSITQGHRLDSTVLRSFRDRKWPRIHNSRSRSSSITRTEAVIRSGSVTSSSETTSRAGSLSRGVTPETITSQYNADPLKPNDTSSPSSLPADDAISPSPLLAPPSTETSNGGNTGIPKVSQNKDKKADFDEPHFSCEQTSLDQALIDSAEKPLSPAARVSPCPGNQPPQPNDMLEQDDIPETSQQRPPTERYFYIRCKESDLNVAQRENIWPTNPLYDESFRKAYDESRSVFIIFTSSMSRSFCGIARMASPITWPAARTIFDRSKYRQWMQLEWISRSSISFQTVQEKLSLPTYALIRRNGDELATHFGRSICDLFMEQDSVNASLSEVSTSLTHNIDHEKDSTLELNLMNIALYDFQQDTVEKHESDMDIEDLDCSVESMAKPLLNLSMMAPGVTDCGTEVLVIKQEPFQPAEDVNMDISTEIQRGKMPLNEPLLNSHGKLDPYIQIVDKVKDLELQSVGPKQDFKDSGQVDLEQGSDNDTHREEKAKTERRVLRSPPPPSPPTSRKSFPLPPRPPSRPIDSWQGNKGYRVPKAPYWNNWPYEQPKRHPSGRYRSPPPPIRIAPTNYALAPRYKDERSPTSNIWCKDTYERSLPSPRAYAMRHSPYSRRSYPILPPIDPRVALSTPMDPRQNRHETHIEPHSPFQTDRSPVPQKKSSVPKSK